MALLDHNELTYWNETFHMIGQGAGKSICPNAYNICMLVIHKSQEKQIADRS